MLKLGLTGGLLGAIVGLLISVVIWLNDRASEQNAMINAQRERGEGLQLLATGPSDAVSAGTRIAQIADARQQVIATFLFHLVKAGAEADAMRLLERSADKDERDGVLAAVVRELLALRLMTPDDREEDDVNPAMLNAQPLPGGETLGTNKTQGIGRSDEIRGIGDDDRVRVPSSGADLDGRKASSTSSKPSTLPLLNALTLRLAKQIEDPLQRAEVLSEFLAKLERENAPPALKGELYSQAQDALTSHDRSQPLFTVDWRLVWSWCWPVVLGVAGFIVVCLAKPAIEALGKAFGEAVVTKIDFNRVVELVIHGVSAKIGKIAKAEDLIEPTTPPSDRTAK
jgi:hypothetical protein